MKRVVRDSAAVAFKEMKQLGRDPVSLALTFVFPILLIGMFILLIAVIQAPSLDIAVVVVDLDSSPESRILIDKMTSSSVIRVSELVQTEEQASRAVESGKVAGAVIIPKGLGNSLLTHRPIVIVLQTDNSKRMSSSLIQTALTSMVQELLEVSGAQFGVNPIPVEVVFRPVSGRPVTGDPFLPGFLGMIAILGAFDDIINAISRERERGTFPRLVLTPVHTISIYTGKMLATILLTIVRTSLMLAIFALMGLVIRGSISLVYLTTSLIAMFTLSVGLIVSSGIHSSSTLTVLEIALTLPLFELTGIFESPELLASGGRAIARLLPWTYGNEALRRVMYLGLGFDAIAADLLILFLTSLALLPLATIVSRRTM